MKKINKFFSSCSKLTRCFAVALFAAAISFGMVSCSNGSGDDDNAEPEVYTAQPENESSCGAYAMAYYLAKTGQIKYSEIQSKANEFYANIQFSGITGTYSFLNGYSNPVSMISQLKPTYASEAKLKMISNPQTEAETGLANLATELNIASQIEGLSSFEAGFANGDYCLEILKSGSTSFHYLLTFKKGNELYCRDPWDGKEYKRSEIQSAPGNDVYEFCNGGVFVTPKN